MTEAQADLNYIQDKRHSLAKGISATNIADWEKELKHVISEFRLETIEQNLNTLEDYIKLCIKYKARPVGFMLPFSSIIRQNYPKDLIFYVRYVLHQFEKMYDFTFIDLFDLSLGYENFQDLTHLNARGAFYSSKELNKQLHERNILPLK